MDEQEMQEAFQEYQMIQQQMEALEEYMEDIQDNIEERNQTREAIDELSESEQGDQAFFPVGEGAFAVGEVKDPETVLVDLGADSYARKDIDEATELIDGQIEELRDAQDRVQEQMEELQEKIQDLAPKLQKLQQAMQGGGGQALGQ